MRVKIHGPKGRCGVQPGGLAVHSDGVYDDRTLVYVEAIVENERGDKCARVRALGEGKGALGDAPRDVLLILLEPIREIEARV